MPATHVKRPQWSFPLTACVLFVAILSAFSVRAAQPGETQIARWKGNARAAFLIMFDDSWPSHWQVAAPALSQRGMTATFYICPGKGEYKKFAKEWEEKLWRTGMVYGVHTMTHKGVKNLENAEWEIGECARVIRKITGASTNRLVSYGQPGVGPNDWNISKAEFAALLQEHRLVDRPPFTGHGAVYHWKTAEQMLALADKAITNGGMEYIVIHGVERITPNWGYQDFWPLKQEILFKLLDGLKERRDAGQLWITDHISMHQYEMERKSATARVANATENEIRIELSCEADPLSYDYPLTLRTQVPKTWTRVRVAQGTNEVTAPADNGAVQYEAVPSGKTQVVLRNASH